MRWTKQPPPRTRIDRNNPLTNGLVAAWIGTDKNNAISTGYPFAAAAGSVDRPSVIFNDAYERVNSNGITGWRPADPDRVGGDDFIDVNFSSSFTSGSADWTLFSVNQFYNSNHDHALWGLDASGNFQIWADTNGGALRLGIYDGASATYAAESSLNDNTRPYCIGVSFNSAADDCNGYIDGTLAVSDTGFSGSAAGNLQINASTTTKIGYQGIFLWAIWDRELSPSEHKQLAENPWQIYSTRRFALADPLPDTRVLEVPTKEWTKQPPAGTKLDLSNSIVKKAAFLWSGSNSGGAYGIDHISGVQGVQSTWSTNNVNFNNTEKGSAINSLYNATDANVIEFTGLSQAINYHSHFFIYRSNNTTQAYRSAMATYSGGWTSGTMGLASYPIGTSSQSVQAYDGANFYTWSSVGPITTDTDWYSMCIQSPVTVLSYGDLYINGKYIGQSSVQRASDDVTITQVALGGNRTWDNEGLGGDLLFAAAFKDALTPGEIESLHNNPWQIFKPQELQVSIEYEEAGFDDDAERRLYFIPQEVKWTRK